MSEFEEMLKLAREMIIRKRAGRPNNEDVINGYCLELEWQVIKIAGLDSLLSLALLKQKGKSKETLESLRCELKEISEDLSTLRLKLMRETE